MILKPFLISVIRRIYPPPAKKAALSSRARFVNLPAQGWHYCKNLQFSDFAIGHSYVMIGS